MLADRWPKCFALYEQRRSPLKVGIRQDVVAVLGANPPFGWALGYYTHSIGYLQKMRPGAQRVDLDRSAAGFVH